MTSLYLAPLSADIKSLYIGAAVACLLSHMEPYLRRLVFDFPVRPCDSPTGMREFRRIFLGAISSLTRLEEFVFVRWYTYIGIGRNVWRGWRRLRRLALDYSPTVDCDRFWSTMCGMPDLEIMVLVQTIGLAEDDVRFRDANAADDWRRAQELLVATPGREVRIVLVAPGECTYTHAGASAPLERPHWDDAGGS